MELASVPTRRRTLPWLVGLGALLVAAVVASATVGPVSIPPHTVARIAFGALPAVPSVAPGPQRTIVLQVRLPRILLGAVVGFALAAAGTVMQGFFRNPMADPSIVGVSTGAAVGAVAAIVAPVSVPFGLPAAAFVGALLTGFGVYLAASRDGETPVATLLLAGVAAHTFLGAVVSLLLVHAGWELREAVYWLMGHLHDAAWPRVWVAGGVVVAVFPVLYAYADQLDLLALGEADAHALGVEVERTKRVLLALASVVTAATVAVSGVIGFVGLVVPHAMRLLVGATFLVVADTVARAGTTQLPVGIVTALVGAPFFLYLLRSREVHAV